MVEKRTRSKGSAGKRKKKGLIITVAGKPGSGKSTVASKVASKLGMMHYSIGDFLREIAERKEVSLLEISKQAEKNREIDQELDDRQKLLGKEERNFIIDSRLGFHFIPQSIKIFLDVSLEEGAERIFKEGRGGEKENSTLEKTKANIKKRMASEQRRYKKYYNLDPYDLAQFDCLIDTTGMPVKEVVEKIVAYVKGLQ
jgi:CMP/dCMP kinase